MSQLGVFPEKREIRNSLDLRARYKPLFRRSYTAMVKPSVIYTHSP
jgi:hypothetical protein